MLAAKLLIRHWRSGELKLLSLSLILAVTVLSAIAIFTNRLHATLLIQSNAVLGADTVISGSHPRAAQWQIEAAEAGIKTTESVQFSSVVYAGDAMQLASIKAVAEGYPLRGTFELSDQPFALQAGDIQAVQGIPARGEVWVDSRLFTALQLTLGAKLAVGDAELRVAHLVMREPDGLNPLSAFGARVVMNALDLPQTQVLQPGSEVNYRWLLAQDDPQKLDAFVQYLKPQLDPHQKIITVDNAQERLGNTLETANKFLLLTAVIAVLLAGVAIAIAAKQFADRHANSVALMKSLGASAARVRLLYGVQLLLLGSTASGIGLVCGSLIQAAVVSVLQVAYQQPFVAASLQPFVLSFMSGILCLIGFALPALWFLPQVPPLKILRQSLMLSRPQLWVQGLCAALAVLGLVVVFSGDWRLAGVVTLALVLVLALALLAAFGLLKLCQRWLANAGGVWRLALASLHKKSNHSAMQILVFAIAMMLLLTISILRNSLIDEWKLQIPKNAPNHYLINIPAADAPVLQQQLAKGLGQNSVLMPNVRGRLIAINNVAPSEPARAKENALQRELNLTWSNTLPASNTLVKGQWWTSWHRSVAGVAGVSVEEGVAKNLGLQLGDTLRFSIGGLTLTAEIASVRQLNWQSMQLNYFFIFEPGVLDAYSPTYMSSIHLEASNKAFLYQVLREHPSILLLEFERILNSIQVIMDQVAQGVQLVLYLTLLGGALVLWAAVMSSLDTRKQEAGLLRALGAGRRLIQGSVLIEFALMGFLAGLVAILGAECLIFGLQKWVFKIPVQPHLVYWLIAPACGGLGVALLGYFGCRPILTTPPIIVLREAA